MKIKQNGQGGGQKKSASNWTPENVRVLAAISTDERHP
jgi:hypothetical protein